MRRNVTARFAGLLAAIGALVGSGGATPAKPSAKLTPMFPPRVNRRSVPGKGPNAMRGVTPGWKRLARRKRKTGLT